MSESLLERLEKKLIPKKNKPVEVIIKKGQIQVEATIIDKTDSGFDVDQFLKRLKNRGLTAPKIGEQVAEIVVPETAPATDEPETAPATAPATDEPETAPATDEPETAPATESTKKPQKIKSKITLPGEPVTKKKKRKSRKPKPREEEIVLDIAATLIEINDRPIGDRIKPKAPNILIKAPAYYLNNREIFINFINGLFKKYTDKLGKEQTNISCDSKKSKDFSLLIHQEIVRDYMNIYTPYRGLLLYHGLGAGKTCASIAIAEGMKDNKKVIIMTPASLRTNYKSELKYCGDPIYKTNQYWEKINTEGNKHQEQALSEVLGLSIDYIRKNKGAWLVDMKKDSNFELLSPQQQQSIDNQINKMIDKKYNFINYNGMRNQTLDDLIEYSEEEEGSPNPFDNKIIIIDEAHNFVSRIVNKLGKNNKSLSVRLYELILNAHNCKIVFLTGTPIINFPNEIAILFNMLRGYIKTFVLPIDTSDTTKTINQAKIMSIFKKEKLLDYVEYNPRINELIITRNPFGFISRNKTSGVYAGVSNNNRGTFLGGSAIRDDNSFKNSIIKKLRENNIKVVKKGIKIKTNKALPDTLKTFNSLFINPISDEFKNIDLFKRRILGLASYFRSAQESLLPRYDEEKDTHIIKIPMSDYQLGLYEEARKAERKEALRNARKKNKPGGEDGIYGSSSSSYRVFSRVFCNFVFPNEIDEETEKLIRRPLPKEDSTVKTSLSPPVKKGEKTPKNQSRLNEDILDGSLIEDRIDDIDGRYDLDDIERLKNEVKDITDASYPVRQKEALALLEKNADKYLTPTALEKYSPKFLEVLKNLENHEYKGLHLIYSQFRTLEGIGILALILQHNGFARFKITKNSSRIWEIDIKEEDLGKPTFALYTGTESAEEKELIRNIFNGTWDALPTPLTNQLKKISTDNNMGQIIKVFMITSSGSEGITLKNTRYVHIIEPYWHPVRTEQVIGRARRICSHQDLDEEYKTVEVFFYLMTFTEEQIKKVSTELKLKDVSRIDKRTPLTSDEALFEISRIKQRISKGILTSIKEASIDCWIHGKSNAKEGILCYSFGQPSVNTFAYKPDYSDPDARDSVSKLNKKKITWSAFPLTIQGTAYALKRTDPKNKKIGEVYDLNSYQQARKHGTNPVQLGRTEINPKNPKNIIYIRKGEEGF